MNTKKKTILVVDDVPDEILILEEILKAEYQVKAVTGGLAAIKIAQSDNPPDLILLDIMMPDMDGFEVCRRLKSNTKRAVIPVIFLTAKADNSDEKLGFELGAADYIRKPVDPEIMLSRIKANLEQKDKTLRISEVRYRRLFETAQDGIMIVDNLTGIIVDINLSMSRLIGMPQEAFLGKRFMEFEFIQGIFDQQKELSLNQRMQYIRYKDLPLTTYDKRKIYVEFFRKDYEVNERLLSQINIREITDLVKTEHERDKFAAKLAHYLSTSPTITFSLSLKNGLEKWQWISENVLTILGYSSEEALLPNWWFRNINDIDRENVLSILSDLTTHESASREYRFMKKNRSIVWVHTEMRLISEQGIHSEIIGTLTDISDRKRNEEEIHLKSSALEAAANAVFITDRDGIIKWANPAFSILSGYRHEECIGQNARDLIKSGKQDGTFYQQMWDTILEGKVWSGRLENRKKNGELFYDEMTITPVLDDLKYISHFVAVNTDITDKVLAQMKLEVALHTKEVLLREIHHRVNNNLQVMISLLNISTADINDAIIRDKLEDISRRMHSIAIIHSQFHEAEDMSQIEFTRYLKELLVDMKSDYPDGYNRVKTEFEENCVYLNLEQAVPTGLIVTELISNALKHAYPNVEKKGSILIQLKNLGDNYLELVVKDEGVGLPITINPEHPNTIGMILISVLATQLNGIITFNRDSGTCAILKFQINEREQENTNKREKNELK